jgi:hypothetical protein
MATIPQRIILSRKGFDKTAGGFPSPIIPLGTHDALVSIPIPSRSGIGPQPFQTIQITHRVGPHFANMGDLLPLGQPKTRLSPLSDAHLDPDLDSKAINRTGTWMPAFGQAKTAAKHLHKQGVCHGDLFLFFGWFRNIKRNGTTWSFVSADSGQNIIFGWLQIENVGTSANLSSLLQQFPGLCTTRTAWANVRVIRSILPLRGSPFPRYK